MLVVSQPPPLAFLVFLLSDWWEACATSPPAAEVGEPLAPFRRNGEQGGRAFPRPQLRLK